MYDDNKAFNFFKFVYPFNNVFKVKSEASFDGVSIKLYEKNLII